MTEPAELPALASLTELETRMRRPLTGTPEQDSALAALVDASALVRAEVPPALLNPPVPAALQAAVVTVVCQSAARAVRNPEGYSSETAGQYTYRYGEPAITGVYLSDEERAVLRKLAGRHGLRSTRTPYGAGEHLDTGFRLASTYADDTPGEPIPWEEPPVSPA